MIYSLGDRHPQIHESCFIAPSAEIIGDIRMAASSSAWFHVVMRGDNAPITIGERSNVQDGSVLHADIDVPLTIGYDVTIGHQVMLHGCTVGDGSLVGINAVVLNHAKIGKYCLIAANTLVTEGKEIPDYSVVMGSPGKVVQTLNEEQAAALAFAAHFYVENSKRFRTQLRETSF